MMAALILFNEQKLGAGKELLNDTTNAITPALHSFQFTSLSSE